MAPSTVTANKLQSEALRLEQKVGLKVGSEKVSDNFGCILVG